MTRQTVNKNTAVRKTKKALTNAFNYQKLNKGTCFVEIVGNCPSNWKMTPIESNIFIDEQMVQTFPLGDVKVPSAEDLKSLNQNGEN